MNPNSIPRINAANINSNPKIIRSMLDLNPYVVSMRPRTSKIAPITPKITPKKSSNTRPFK
jgi:hypothetical protein